MKLLTLIAIVLTVQCMAQENDTTEFALTYKERLTQRARQNRAAFSGLYKSEIDSGYCTKCGKVSGVDTETGVEITGLNTSEFISGALIVLDSENFKQKLAKVSESYYINMVIAVVIYQHPDSGIIKIFTKR